MPKPMTVWFAGNRYPTIGWALGDILRLEPRASDQRVAEILDVTPQTVFYWRRKCGIPAYKRRGANPYLESTNERHN
jgi:hypothetical protein